MKERAFTIVELLIVIVVIGILAAISIASYSGLQNRAKVSSANSDLTALYKAINLARINESKVLKDITGSMCTGCGNQAVYEQSLDRIGTAAGVDLSKLKAGNPWGGRYSIDENELENMATNNGCNRDSLTVGSNVPSGVTGIISPIVATYSC